jgi:hypothetical protein
MKTRIFTVFSYLAIITLLALGVPGVAQPWAAQAQSPAAQNVELVGHIGGVTDAVFVQGNYAYIGEGPRLTILDISNPASPSAFR